MRRLCSFADLFVFFTGTSRNHLKAVVRAVQDGMKDEGIRPISVEGFNQTGWVVLDYGDVVAHFFTDDSRRYYNLERLWADGRRIDWRPKTTGTRASLSAKAERGHP